MLCVCIFCKAGKYDRQARGVQAIGENKILKMCAKYGELIKYFKYKYSLI